MIIEAYHGTDKNFTAFKQTPQRRGIECGFHFGSLTAAGKRLYNKVLDETDLAYEWMKVVNILPRAEAQRRIELFVKNFKPIVYRVNLEVDNLLRMDEWDRFSSWTLMDIISKLFDPTNRFFVPQERSKITDREIEDYIDYLNGETTRFKTLAGSVDLRDGRQATVLKSCKWLEKFLATKGFDGIVYQNTVEGGGDSYIVFNPQRITITDKYQIPVDQMVQEILKNYPLTT